LPKAFKRIIIPAIGLSSSRISYYEEFGFRFAWIVPLNKIRQEPFLVRRQGHESAVHTYVVEMIREFFLSHGLRPRRWITKGVDLSVRQRESKKRLAIEVETGGAYRINKKALIRKFTYLVTKFDVVIVVTNSFYLARYRSLFPTLPVMLRKDTLTYLFDLLPTLGYPRIRHKYYTPRSQYVPFWFFRVRRREKK